MFILKNNGSSVVVPGYLIGYKGEAMMPDYDRYMVTLPIFLTANAICVAMSAYALMSNRDQAAFGAFSIFMAIFAAKMFSQRLVRVSFLGSYRAAEAAPTTVRLNNFFVALCLLMIGASFARLTGHISSTFFTVFGVGMVAMSVAKFSAFRRGRGGSDE
ncbi:hypothetical protein [Stenotrophomonas cyclobalanopsidis]|uniref:hypothetical protein n=1 Tax=Stenotrophomonas cyclobalanopsidis TaxID=2771362 RepID=UPI003460F547